MTISPSGRWLPALTLTIIFTAAAASAAAGDPPVSQPAPSAATLLRPARVWTAGEPVHEGWVVLIRGSRIVAVGAAGAARAEAGARVIELPGATLLPGLMRSEEHTSELQSQSNLVCRLLLEKKKKKKNNSTSPAV